MTYGQPSGTTSYVPNLSDIAIDAFERCGIYDIQSKHMFSFRRSANLRLQHWANRGLMLWQISRTPYYVDLLPGVQTYPLTQNVVDMLDTYRRLPLSTTTTGAAGVDGSIIPLLSGEPVPQNAVVTTTDGSLYFNVQWTDNGLSPGDPVAFLWPITVGGLTIGGVYNVVAVPDADNITLIGNYAATSTSSTSVMTQNATDILMTPISRNDWAAISNKSATGAPTLYWFERTITPQINVWPVPDDGQNYQLFSYLAYQIDDANPTGGQTAGIPQRFWYTLTADLAADLAFKFARDRVADLKAEAAQAWKEAAEADTESVSTFWIPSFGGYG